METQWFVHQGGATYGPVPEGTLRSWVAERRLCKGALLSRGPDDPWVSAETVLGVDLPEVAAPGADTLSAYNAVAETVGLVPSFRSEDTRYQAVFVGVGSGVGAALGAVGGIIGLLGGGDWGGFMIWALAGLAAGAVVSVIVSGAIIGARGLKRTSRR